MSTTTVKLVLLLFLTLYEFPTSSYSGGTYSMSGSVRQMNTTWTHRAFIWRLSCGMNYTTAAIVLFQDETW